MRGLAILLLSLACLACHALPAGAQAGAQQAVLADGTKFVPAFAPPLDKPLRYRLIREQVTPSGNRRTVFDQQIVFQRRKGAEGGFIMRISMLRVTMGGRTYNLAEGEGLPPEARPMFLPMAMDLDRNGQPQRMRDWPRLRKALLGLAPLMTRLLETDPARREAVAQYSRNFLQHYTALSAEEAVDSLVQGWPPVLSELGHEVTLGRALHATTSAPIPIGGQFADFETTAKWTVSGDGRTLHVTRRSVPSAESLRALGQGLADASKGIARAGTADEMVRTLSQAKVTICTEAAFDRTSGLVRRAVFEKAMVVKGQSGTDRLTIEAL